MHTNDRAIPRLAAIGELGESDLSTPGVLLQLNRYCWTGANEVRFHSDVDFLEMRLARHRTSSVIFSCDRVEREIGELVFVPAGRDIDARWNAGNHRGVRISFAPDRFSFSDIEWTEANLFSAHGPALQSIKGLMLRLTAEAEHPGFASDVMVESLSRALSVEIHRHFLSSPPRQARRSLPGMVLSPAQLQLVEEMVQSEIGTISLIRVAEELRMSPRHLSRLFVNSTGRSFSDYVAQCRLNRAKLLLAQSGEPIKRIAHRCGFLSVPAFCNAFRRSVSMTPYQYRQQLH